MGTTYTEPTSQSGQTGGRNQPPRPLYVGDKEQYVREMFAAIAPRYDLLNDLLSFRSHKRWRRLAVRMAQVAAGRPLPRCLHRHRRFRRRPRAGRRSRTGR